jgi:hypothetical protein
LYRTPCPRRGAHPAGQLWTTLDTFSVVYHLFAKSLLSACAAIGYDLDTARPPPRHRAGDAPLKPCRTTSCIASPTVGHIRSCWLPARSRQETRRCETRDKQKNPAHILRRRSSASNQQLTTTRTLLHAFASFFRFFDASFRLSSHRTLHTSQ